MAIRPDFAHGGSPEMNHKKLIELVHRSRAEKIKRSPPDAYGVGAELITRMMRITGRRSVAFMPDHNVFRILMLASEEIVGLRARVASLEAELGKLKGQNT